MYALNELLPDPKDAPSGRATPLKFNPLHYVTGNSMLPPFPPGLELFYCGMGCFWGAERFMWRQAGVYVTAAGYAGGYTPNPLYEEVCTGRTGHAEVVLVVYDPALTNLELLLKAFWEAHDPTQGMRQGNDIGTQYRSALYATSDAQLAIMHTSAARYGQALQAQGYGALTTELRPAPPFYYAEDYHQQYLAKQPDGYCGLRGTGVSYPA
jgi:peptide-methionine (S)-S-oxide reductase